jgi:hypothetical protein
MQLLIAIILLLLAGAPRAQACVPPPSGVVSWWTGDGDASDSIGANDGANAGGVSFPAGKVARAFAFDGIDDDVAIGNPPGLHLSGGPFSIDAWVRFATLTSPPGPSGPCFLPGRCGHHRGQRRDLLSGEHVDLRAATRSGPLSRNRARELCARRFGTDLAEAERAQPASPSGCRFR